MHQPNCGMERSLLQPYNVVFEPDNAVVMSIKTASVTRFAATDATHYVVIVRARVLRHQAIRRVTLASFALRSSLGIHHGTDRVLYA